VNTLIRQLSAAFPEFSATDADRVRKLSDRTLDQLTDAIATRLSWTEIQRMMRRNTAT
jgi:hypothetical protein